MRMLPVVVSLLVLSGPVVTHSQSLVVHGSAGPTLVDRGYSLAGGAGWTPGSRLTVALGLEHTHLFSRERRDGRGDTTFRGGAITLGVAELRVALFGRDRVTPYLVGGLATGRSRPNVTATFPARVTNGVHAVFGNAGVHVPLRSHVGLYADVRMLVGEETGELLAIAPLRAGLSWRF